MNEQLIKQLAEKIDAQVSQAVQSHDVQVKGTYLWQTYPQVHSCANYNEAVFLLAREQAELQQPQQTVPQGFGGQVGFGTPAGFGVQPQTDVNSTGQVQNGFTPQLQSQAGFSAQPFGTPQFQHQAPTGFASQPFGAQSASSGFGQQAGFGSPPPANVFGTPVVPQTGNAAGTNFTAFQPPKSDKPPSNGKVFGFIPSNIFAISIIVLIAVAIIIGLIFSVSKAMSSGEAANGGSGDTPAIVDQQDNSADDPYGGLFN